MGDSQDIQDRVFRVVSDQLGFDTEKLTLGTSFVDDLGSDSLDLVELVMALEEEFQLQIEEEDGNNIQTIGDAVQYIEQELSKN